MRTALSLSIFQAVAIAATCNAAECVWTGAGGDGNWSTPANWRDSAVPGQNDTAIFENSEPLSLRLPSGSGAMNFQFLGKDVDIGSDDGRHALYIYGHGTSTVEVVAGTTVTCSNEIYMYFGDNKALAKAGGGALRIVGHEGATTQIWNLKELIVEGGEFACAPAAGYDYGAYINATTTNVLVKSGATLSLSGWHAINNNYTVISLENGATFNVDGRGSNIEVAGLVGSGTVAGPFATPSSPTPLVVRSRKFLYDFSGTVGPEVALKFEFIEDVPSIDVSSGMLSGAHTVGAYAGASVLPLPTFLASSGTQAGDFRVSGGEVWLANNGDNGIVDSLELAGGNCVLDTGYKAAAAATVEDPSVILFDGGTLTAGMRNSQYWWWLPSSASQNLAIRVGANGGVLRTRDRGGYNPEYLRIALCRPFETAPGVAGDGGMTFDIRDTGVELMFFAPVSIGGPFTLMDGRIALGRYSESLYSDLSTYPSFFGTGDFTLDCGLLSYHDNSGNLPEGTLRLASGAGSAMRVRGSSEIRFREGSAKSIQHVVAGADGAAANSALVVERGGALFLYDGTLAVDGGASTFKVNGGVATNASTTLVKAPVFSENTANANSFMDVHFLCYDGTKGFHEFTGYANSLAAGENAVVGSGATLAANGAAHIAAMRLPPWASLTVNAGARLTIGNGEDPACLLLAYASEVQGTGTIDFGASEGVVVVGTHNEARGHHFGCSLSGSGGVSFVSRPDFANRVVSLERASDYTGGTRISAATVRVQDAQAFSSGDVYVRGGYRNGGGLIFDRPLTITNNLHVSGGGHRLPMWSDDGYGAITFTTNGVTLSGNVELTARTEVFSSGEGTFAGTVSGDRLVVVPGSGRIVLAANNTYTGGTEIVSATVALGGASPSLGTGAVSLDNGTVRFENTAPITFTNFVEGVGTFRVCDADVTFAIPQLRGGRPTKFRAGSWVRIDGADVTYKKSGGMLLIYR